MCVPTRHLSDTICSSQNSHNIHNSQGLIFFLQCAIAAAVTVYAILTLTEAVHSILGTCEINNAYYFSISMQMYKKEKTVLSIFNNTFGTTLEPLVHVDEQDKSTTMPT